MGKRLTCRQLVASSALCGQPWCRGGIRSAYPVTSDMVAVTGKAITTNRGQQMVMPSRSESWCHLQGALSWNDCCKTILAIVF